MALGEIGALVGWIFLVLMYPYVFCIRQGYQRGDALRISVTTCILLHIAIYATCT